MGHSGLQTFGKGPEPQQHAALQEVQLPSPSWSRPEAHCERLGGEVDQKPMPDHTQGEQWAALQATHTGWVFAKCWCVIDGVGPPHSLFPPSCSPSFCFPAPFPSCWLCSSLAHSELAHLSGQALFTFRGIQGKVDVTPNSYCTFSRNAGSLWELPAHVPGPLGLLECGSERPGTLPCLSSHPQRQLGFGINETNLGTSLAQRASPSPGHPDGWVLTLSLDLTVQG